MAKRTRSSIGKAMDRIVSRIVRLRDGRCVVCGSEEDLQCGHYFSRSRNRTRWDLQNCNCQCMKCNWAHEGNPEPYRRYMLQRYGQDTLDHLERTWHQSAQNPYTIIDLLELEQELKEELNAIEGSGWI